MQHALILAALELYIALKLTKHSLNPFKVLSDAELLSMAPTWSKLMPTNMLSWHLLSPCADALFACTHVPYLGVTT